MKRALPIIILVLIVASPFLYFKLVTATKKTETIVVQPPFSKPSAIENTDASFLNINLLQQRYEVSLRSRTIATNQLDSVERFITSNLQLVNPDKVAITGNKATPEFERIRSLLQKNGITKIMLIANEH